MQPPLPTIAPSEISPSSSPSSEDSHTLGQQLEVLRASASLGLPLCLGCDPHTEGVLSATGLAYLAHLPLSDVRLVPKDFAQPRFGETYVATVTDAGLAQRVYQGFQRHMQEGCPHVRHNHCAYGCGRHCSWQVLLVGASDEEDMPQALFCYLVAGFTYGRRVHTLNSTRWIARAEELATAVSNECERARQFVRFSLMEAGYYGAIFRPKANVIPLVANHFAKRMITERFTILDPVHGVLVLGDKGTTGFCVLSPQEAERLSTSFTIAESEPYIQALWKSFYDALALPYRGITERGYDLRRHFMPKRFWEGLPELFPVDAAERDEGSSSRDFESSRSISTLRSQNPPN